MKHIILPLVILWSCTSSVKDTALPIYGNTRIEGTDTTYQTIKDFKLHDQDSAIVTNESLQNQVYVADFFFTSCPTICPQMKAQMLRVYQKFEGNEEVAIVSHTIDPQYDTIPLLKEYAARLGVSSNQWKFLWGEQDVIYDLAEGSYMSIANEDSEAPGGFVHSGMFVLVDKEKRIRGAYDGTKADQVDILMKDIEKLLAEYPRKTFGN